MRLLTLCVLLSQAALAQPPQGIVLTIDLKDYVLYEIQTGDYNRLASDPGKPMADPVRTFGSFSGIGDVVAVNGRRAKGTFVDRANWARLSPNAPPGQAIADTTRSPMVEWHCEILQEDGTPVGSIAGIGLNGGSAPPGAPSGSTGGTWIVTGGTGAFLGVRGQGAFGRASVALDPRRSAAEDPANRRLHGGGALPLILYLIPLSRPEVISTASGPAVVHASDFTPVTAAKPAKSGEVLTLFASGLGPTRPGVDPGQPFPADPPQVVNSPLDLIVNGTPAEVLYAGGYAGAVDRYQVNFRVPEGIGAGLASVQLSVGWISGPEVKIAIQ